MGRVLLFAVPLAIIGLVVYGVVRTVQNTREIKVIAERAIVDRDELKDLVRTIWRDATDVGRVDSTLGGDVASTLALADRTVERIDEWKDTRGYDVFNFKITHHNQIGGSK